MAQLPELMTVAEVAEALRVADETIHRWARNGKLDAVRLPGGLKRFRRADIEAILVADQDPDQGTGPTPTGPANPRPPKPPSPPPRAAGITASL